GAEGGQQRLGDGLDQLLRLPTLAEAGEPRRVLGAPRLEERGDAAVEAVELWVREDRGAHLADRQARARVAGPAGGLEERGAHAGQHRPVAGERVEVALRGAAVQVRVD